jgi:hypothetical protein
MRIIHFFKIYQIYIQIYFYKYIFNIKLTMNRIQDQLNNVSYDIFYNLIDYKNYL